MKQEIILKTGGTVIFHLSVDENTTNPHLVIQVEVINDDYEGTLLKQNLKEIYNLEIDYRRKTVSTRQYDHYMDSYRDKTSTVTDYNIVVLKIDTTKVDDQFIEQILEFCVRRIEHQLKEKEAKKEKLSTLLLKVDFPLSIPAPISPIHCYFLSPRSHLTPAPFPFLAFTYSSFPSIALYIPKIKAYRVPLGVRDFFSRG